MYTLKNNNSEKIKSSHNDTGNKEIEDTVHKTLTHIHHSRQKIYSQHIFPEKKSPS